MNVSDWFYWATGAYQRQSVVKGVQSAWLVLLAALSVGCEIKEAAPLTEQTLSAVRAQRRLFDGAPPVIPHPPLGASCSACHTKTGREVPQLGFSPANPHLGTWAEGGVQYCVQCHVFRTTHDQFADSTFDGLRQDLRRGQRLYSGAPPAIPHPTLMRENCRSCHSGPAARPEIMCTHPERSNCVQCHLTAESLTSFSANS